MGQFEYLKKAQEEYEAARKEYKAKSKTRGKVPAKVKDRANYLKREAEAIAEGQRAVHAATEKLFAARQIAAAGITDETLQSLCK